MSDYAIHEPGMCPVPDYAIDGDSHCEHWYRLSEACCWCGQTDDEPEACPALVVDQ